ncbi:MAG: hypothetical protein A2252_11950 [Elusimicrobia bacterium RIFOXYA2_FULL_39_19]|nr:MAG: hypothetical protein A2252_11950 [Elusimicrobia bacterium RIFOXYA2_FULL_39_19]
MSEFNELEEELQKIENEFSTDETDEILRHIVSPSAADYWKKRLDDEKVLWTKMTEDKEKDKKITETRLSKANSEIEALTKKIHELESVLQKEVALFQDKLKSQESDFHLERERSSYGQKIKELEKENNVLHEELRQLKENEAVKIDAIKKTHDEEVLELADSQNSIIESIEAIAGDIKEIEGIIQKQSEEIAGQKDSVTKTLGEKNLKEAELAKLKAEYENKVSELNLRETDLKEYFRITVKYFSGKIKPSLGTILGIANYCTRRLKASFIGKNAVLKKQINLLEGVVADVSVQLDKLVSLSGQEEMSLQEISPEKFIARISEDVDVSMFPAGLKMKADQLRIISALKKHCENASYFVKYNQANKEIEFKILTPDKLENTEDLVRLKYLIYSHGWKAVFGKTDNKTFIMLYIKVY